MFFSWFFIYPLLFILSILGINLYRKTVINSFPELIKKSNQSEIANGAGGVLWDISFLFLMYIFWYKDISTHFLSLILVSTFFFTIFGWADDYIELKPMPKLIGQFFLASASIFFYFKIKSIPFDLIFFLSATLYFVWIVNSINFIDILDGLACSISFIIFTSFCLAFLYIKGLFGFSYSFFWSLAVFAFLTQNIKKPKVYLGDAGAHLIGCSIFFASMEFLENSHFNTASIIPLCFLHGFLLFDFLFVCFVRFKKNKSLLQKSEDHLTFFLLNKYHSKTKTLVLMILFQSIASLSFIWLLLKKVLVMA